MMEDFSDWLNKERVDRYRLDPWPAAAMAAALGQDEPPLEGAPLPLFWHHLYGLEAVHARDTNRDGHRKRGSFLPPVPLPRRMWAGGRLQFEGDLLVGEEVTRRSAVRGITSKAGRTGNLVFVLVEHRLEGAHGRVTEEHDIVYREEAGGEETPAWPTAPSAADESIDADPDEVLLFRYSALTYNGHRIHYDKDYVRNVEGYPGLIVHGPLLATYLFELLRSRYRQHRVCSFSFRAVQPVFVGDGFSANAAGNSSDHLDLWIAKRDGTLAMKAEARLA
ncbi:MAG: MaoC family dehydratase N-terminal domain-containing protein [Geminicoccaceae bacterium]|nr:MaoC family dehydratase N-terminal domain-containing protein [Geminicoccaceae bacterium]